jgi:hypothetical protein
MALVYGAEKSDERSQRYAVMGLLRFALATERGRGFQDLTAKGEALEGSDCEVGAVYSLKLVRVTSP